MRTPEFTARPGQGTPSTPSNTPLVAEVVVRYRGTIMDVRHVGAGGSETAASNGFTIGEADHAAFAAPPTGLPSADAFELVRVEDDRCLVRFGASLAGSVSVSGVEVTLADLAAAGRAVPEEDAFAYALPAGSRCRIEHGDLTFFVRPVPPGERTVGRGEVDRPFLVTTGLSALALGSLFALITFIPADELSWLDEEDVTESRFVGYMMQPPPETPEEPTEPTEEGENSRPEEGAMAHRGESGQMGDPRDSRKAGRYAIPKRSNMIPQLARNQAFEDPSTAGVLGILQRHETSILSSVDGGVFTVGEDDQFVWGTVSHGDVAAGWGVGGLGPVGTGRGGGGMGEGTIGLAGAGTFGVQRRTGSGDRWGRGSGGGFDTRKAKKPMVRIARPESSPGLGKDIIRRVVRAHINEIRHCYNQGLSRDPGLAGRVVSQFTIGPKGNVQFVVIETGSGDRAVDGCVKQSVKRWRFPRPDAGGTVIVTYPFVLSTSR